MVVFRGIIWQITKQNFFRKLKLAQLVQVFAWPFDFACRRLFWLQSNTNFWYERLKLMLGIVFKLLPAIIRSGYALPLESVQMPFHVWWLNHSGTGWDSEHESLSRYLIFSQTVRDQCRQGRLSQSMWEALVSTRDLCFENKFSHEKNWCSLPKIYNPSNLLAFELSQYCKSGSTS